MLSREAVGILTETCAEPNILEKYAMLQQLILMSVSASYGLTSEGG